MAPVIGSHKLKLGMKRLFATMTGGLRIASGLSAILYIAEIFLFLAPVGAGVGLTIAYSQNMFPWPLWAAAAILGGGC